MQIAQILSGYSLGEADMLRRAMGKKIKAEMDAQRARFVDGAVERGIDKAKADEIFDLLAKFADYGFNKSHAAAYALVAYQTAWCKANYPVEFLAASMTLDKSNTDKLAEFRNEASRSASRSNRPRSIFPASISRCASIRGRADHSLRAVRDQGRRRGAGEGAGRCARQAAVSRRFGSWRGGINPREVNKKALESLAAAGAFDELEPDRANAFAAIEPMLALANRAQDEHLAGQSGLFGEGEPAPCG